jgi:NTE family protein
LVFEGGGIRGIAYAGALSELEKTDDLKKLKRVAGTSVGAIQATLVALNYTPEEMARIISDLNLKHFNDGKFIFVGGISRIVNKYGWYRGDKLSEWIGKLIEEKTRNKDLTFADLHALSSTGEFKDLYVTGTNLTKQCPEIFSHETYPQMKIRDAVRISASIPLYFKAVFMDSSGIVYKPKAKGKYDILVDGGITQNFPIHIFDKLKYLNDTDTSSAFAFNTRTLGIRLDSDQQIEYDLKNKGIAPYPISNFKSYVSAFYNIVIENLNRHKLTEKDWNRTISISTAGIGPKVKRISEKNKNILIDSGRKGVVRFRDSK